MSREQIKEDIRKKAEAVQSKEVQRYVRPSVPHVVDPFAETAEDFEDLPPSLPWMGINQKKGFFAAADESQYEELTAVICSFRRTRTMFPPKMGDEPAWFCRTPEDSIKHAGHGILNPELPTNLLQEIRHGGAGGFCSLCQHKNWVNDQKPRCTEQLNLTLYLGEEGFCILRISRTGLKPTSTFLNGFRSRNQKVYGWRVLITLDEQRKSGLVWYTPAFKRIEQLSLEELKQIEAQKGALDASIRNSLATEPQEPNEHEYAYPAAPVHDDADAPPVDPEEEAAARAALMGNKTQGIDMSGVQRKKELKASEAAFAAEVDDPAERVVVLWNKYKVKPEDRQADIDQHTNNMEVDYAAIEQDLKIRFAPIKLKG